MVSYLPIFTSLNSWQSLTTSVTCLFMLFLISSRNLLPFYLPIFTFPYSWQALSGVIYLFYLLIFIFRHFWQDLTAFLTCPLPLFLILGRQYQLNYLLNSVLYRSKQTFTPCHTSEPWHAEPWHAVIDFGAN